MPITRAKSPERAVELAKPGLWDAFHARRAELSGVDASRDWHISPRHDPAKEL
jgi:hypothetical protein